MRLADHIVHAGGWLSLERFMEIALYDPHEGYYSTSIKNVGARGDFSTTATLSPMLGHALAALWQECCADSPHSLPIIEIGAGNAALASSFLSQIGFWKRLKTHYHIVETSPVLRDIQHLNLGSRASIHTTMQKALLATKGHAFIFSNELVDAFPARVFEFTAQGWAEVGLSIVDGAITEVTRLVPILPKSVALEHDTDIGQRVEVHESYEQWFYSWLPLWKSGMMITIDYGDELEPLYHRQPKGTIRAYHQHRRITGMEIYNNIGQYDLTCDVNFSDLLRITGNCLGDEISLISQREFLEPYASSSEVDQYLTHPDGPGERFKVLIHRRQNV